MFMKRFCSIIGTFVVIIGGGGLMIPLYILEENNRKTDHICGEPHIVIGEAILNLISWWKWQPKNIDNHFHIADDLYL